MSKLLTRSAELPPLEPLSLRAQRRKIAAQTTDLLTPTEAVNSSRKYQSTGNLASVMSTDTPGETTSSEAESTSEAEFDAYLEEALDAGDCQLGYHHVTSEACLTRSAPEIPGAPSEEAKRQAKAAKAARQAHRLRGLWRKKNSIVMP